MTSYRYRYLRRAGTAGLALGAGLAIMAPAYAGASVHPSVAGHPSAAAVSAARHAAATPAVAHRLAGFFAHVDRSGTRVRSDAAPTTAKLVGATVPVYYLDAAFVAGKRAAPVARRVFMATAAVAADGGRASVWTAHRAGGWTEVNIASGSDETEYSAKAAEAGRGAIAFEEPQIHAWYALRDDRVVPLNAGARRSVGAAGVSVGRYQRIVHRRYADKLPGTAYARRHELGGFDPRSATRSHAAPAADTDRSSATLPAGVAAAALLACAGGAIALRRRTHRPTRT